jgi:hypothetical protein
LVEVENSPVLVAVVVGSLPELVVEGILQVGEVSSLEPVGDVILQVVVASSLELEEVAISLVVEVSSQVPEVEEI